MNQEELEEEIRPRKETKLDNLGSSLKYNRKRVQTEAQYTLGLNLIILKEKQRGPDAKKIITIQLPNDNEVDFRRRVQTSYEQNAKAKPKVRQDDQFSIEFEPEVTKQSVLSSPSTNRKGQINVATIILIGNQTITNFHTLLRSVHNQQNIAKQKNDTFEKLIQRTQIADNFLNEFGLFYILHTALQKRGITTLLTGQINYELEIDNEMDISKGKPIISTVAKSKSQTSFDDLIFLGSTYSQYALEILVQDINNNLFVSFNTDYQQKQNFLKSMHILIRTILNKLSIEDEVFTIQNIIRSYFCVSSNQLIAFLYEFHCQDSKILRKVNFSESFKHNLSLSKGYECSMQRYSALYHIIQWVAIFSYFEFSLQDLNPYKTREYSNKQAASDLVLEQPYGWKLFALNYDEAKVSQQEFGYVNLFPSSDDLRQELKMLNLDSKEQGRQVSIQFQGVIIFKKILNLSPKYPFLSCQNIDITVYGQQKSYNVLGKVSFQVYETIHTGDINIDNSIVFVRNIADIQLISILTKEIK